MSIKRRDPLPRLSIAPSLNMQQPGQTLYSPALPTSLQQSFHPAFSMSNPLQTPMQSFFVPGPQGRGGHAHHASMQLAAAGIHPPPGGFTPVASHFSRPSMMLPPGVQPQTPSHPFPNRNRRQLSIGGPPKAVLGGPARKLSPLPGTAGSPAPTVPPVKTKKVIVNLPKETVPGEDGESATRSSWARSPLQDDSVYKGTPVIPVEIATAESYPSDTWRLSLPNSIDVYLPGKLAWDTMKQKNIEEKLQKLGVEPGSGSNIPHIHAPHARAASISSPADPALLLFKLNKLQQSQEANSPGGSLTVSPQPPFAPFGLSPSPRGMRFITNRHGHTMSLAQPPSYQSSLFSSSPSPFNPFGPNAILGSESVADSQISSESSEGIYAPQGRVPFAPPLSAVGGTAGHIDFIRGFGLEVPLESEEEDEAGRVLAHEGSDDTQDLDLESEENIEEVIELDEVQTTAPDSRLHSRHVSKLSAALSLRSVGGNFTAPHFQVPEEVDQDDRNDEEVDEGDEADKENEPPQNQDIDPVEEWTGSEDLYLGLETSDEESIGEWSNPSDEERARQQRVDRRIHRRAARQMVDQPRRLPNFPRPPENTLGGFIPRRDDEIISNPSEEENILQGRQAQFVGVATEHYHPEVIHGPIPSIGLGPPPPHSRGHSDQYSAHDPAMAHSRRTSENFGFPQPNHQTVRRESLNPFAKPFVFGAPRDSGSWQPFAGTAQSSASPPSMPLPIVLPTPSHTRLPSIGKPLNVAAPEFKPGGFSFRLPGAPQMPLASASVPTFPEPARHYLEPIASVESTPFKVQGREKRQRRGSSASMEEGDSMSSFKFPMKMDGSPHQNIRRGRSGSFSGLTRHELNPSAQPFTFAGFSAIADNMPWVPKVSDAVDVPDTDLVNGEESLNESSTARANSSGVQGEVAMPVVPKQKRAPIPLDFKHPVSSNTVPAGVFKALMNGDGERTRRGVRSRLSSRDVFEHMQRPSMDDDDVALIAHKIPRDRLVTDPERPTPVDDVFGSNRHSRRRSSFPDALHASPSNMSVAPQDPSRVEIQQIEDVLSQILDEKLADLRHHLSHKDRNTGETRLSSATESMMADIISLFRTQLQESATRSLEDSQMDARGELDFQMIKDVLKDSQQELLGAFQHEIQRAIQHVPSTYDSSVSQEVVPIIEQVGTRTIHAVVEAISELSARQEAAAVNVPGRGDDLIVDKLLNVLSPMIHSLHNDPIDYEFLTRELTQAVKPHIAQLIDLASDKRETASLIVDRILPLLPSLKNANLDTDAITMKLITEVRRAIAPIDAFEIKEQVADLVVERLDSRFAVRDKAFNADILTSRVTESVSQLLDSLSSVPAALQQLADTQKAVDEKQSSFSVSQSQIISSIAELPSKVGSQLEDLKTFQKDILGKVSQPPASVVDPDGNVLVIKNIVETLASDQRKLTEQAQATSLENKTLLDKLNTLPQEFAGVANGLQNALTNLLTSQDNSKREMEELRKLNTEYQIQVTKARGSHGQVRVEKDVLSEKLSIIEGDRDRLRAQAKELQTTASTKVKEMTALETRNKELEDALAKALARLQSADVASETNLSNIADLEKANKELIAEKQNLRLKVDSLNLEVQLANREKESTSKALQNLQTQHTHLAAQQSKWDLLSAATDKIDMVFSLLEGADSDEQKELRRYRDRSEVLEEENASLQKRFKDLETKLANSDRATSTTRQTLAQAQQRSSEWERRANDYQGQLELVQTQFEQSEQTRSQMEADYQLVKMQLEEQEADSRLHQDRYSKSRDQITALESKCVHIQKELEKASAAAKMAESPTPFRPQTNGNTHPPPRPDSRASTIYDPRLEGSNRRISSYSSARGMAPTQNQPSVWDSMHSPTNTNTNGHKPKWISPSIQTPAHRYSSNLAPSTPKQHRPSYNQYQRAPSPTPSTVSVAPTQGDDGWWT